MAGKRAHGVIHPNPFEFDPKDFSEDPLDHGNGGWVKKARAPLPEPWGALYATPNPDGSRKNCANCVAEGTLVLTGGALKRIEDVNNADITYSNGAWRQVNGVTQKKWSHDMVRVKTTHGLQIDVTPDHQVFTDHSWMAACDLKKGYQIDGLYDVGHASEDLMSRDEAFLRGAITGDGWAGNYGIGFGFRESMSCAWGRLIAIGGELFCSKERVQKNSRGVEFSTVQWRTKLAKAFARTINKDHVPTLLWNSSPECAGQYLRGLYTADGSISSYVDSRTNSRTMQVVLNQANKTLVDEVRLLLRVLGIYSTCSVELRAPRYKDLYRVAISRTSSLERYSLLVGFADQRRQRILEDGLRHKKGSVGPECVASITPVPGAFVYDISVPDTHSFYGNGILVHNCVMWASKSKECYIMDPKSEVVADGICGYHVPGSPMEKFKKRLPMTPVTGELAGYEVVPGGTSCDNCKYYNDLTDSGGSCNAVHVDGSPAPVDPKGCCTRWENK